MTKKDNSDFSAFIKDIKKENAGVEILNTQKPQSFLSTGSYALNGILGGDIYSGIAEGKTVALIGESNSGKSFILSQIIKEAVNNKDYVAMIFDSERAVSLDYYDRIGADCSKIIRIPVTQILEFRNLALVSIKKFKKLYPDQKLLVAIDSMGNMAGGKEIADAEAGKEAADMGNNAKMMNSAFRVINGEVDKYGCPLIFTNHVYVDPSNMFATKGVMSGGSKLIYNSHQIIYVTRNQHVEDVMQEDGKNKKQKVGLIMKCYTQKNRVVPEEQECSLQVNFREGVNKYFGLLNWALGAGAIIKNPTGNGYRIPSQDNRHVATKNLYQDDVFTKEVLEKLNEYLKDNNQFCTYSETDMSKLEESILEE